MFYSPLIMLWNSFWHLAKTTRVSVLTALAGPSGLQREEFIHNPVGKVKRNQLPMVQNLQDIQEDAIYLPEASRVIRTCWELKLDGSYDKRCIFFYRKVATVNPPLGKEGTKGRNTPTSLSPLPHLSSWCLPLAKPERKPEGKEARSEVARAGQFLGHRAEWRRAQSGPGQTS